MNLVAAKRILELGVRTGSTTLPLLLGAEKTGGTVISVDINNTEFNHNPSKTDECPPNFLKNNLFIL